ncbi:MAG: c-type cytochrome [Burkholderiales bacterium]
MRMFAFMIGWSLAFASWADESAIRLKDDPKRDIVVRNCLMCHSLDYIPMNSPFLDRKGWEATVTKMIKVMGAPIKPEEVPQIVDYLTRHYGRGG